MKTDVLISGGRVVYPEKTIRADIGITGGKIVAVSSPGELEGHQKIDARGCYVLPGLIDPHVHPVYLDTIGDCSRTAACGGITTLAHYVYAKPGNKLMDKLEEARKEGEANSCTDFVLHGGLFESSKQAEEIPEAFGMGVTSFKVFMSYAKLGWMTDDYAMTKVMDIVARHGGMVAVHAETGLAVDYIIDKLLAEEADFAEHFLETSPDIAEAEGMFRAISIGNLVGCPVYIPHISSARGIDVIRYARLNGYRVFAETCPHYLALTWDELKERGPLGKVGPSIKTEHDRITLWKSMQKGLFDTIGSDHAPKDKKQEDDFYKAPYGAPGIETLLPVLWHEGVNRGWITPNRVAALTSENTAKILGLYPRKGRVDPDGDGDLVIFDPEKEWTVTAEGQHTNAGYSLLEGKTLLGGVRSVLSGGRLVVDEGEFRGEPGEGRFLTTQAGGTSHPSVR